jgi:hypothetical protein
MMVRCRKVDPFTLPPADRDCLLRLALDTLENNGAGCAFFERQDEPGVYYLQAVSSVQPEGSVDLSEVEAEGNA